MKSRVDISQINDFSIRHFEATRLSFSTSTFSEILIKSGLSEVLVLANESFKSVVSIVVFFHVAVVVKFVKSSDRRAIISLIFLKLRVLGQKLIFSVLFLQNDALVIITYVFTKPLLLP